MSTIDYDALLKTKIFNEQSLINALSEYYRYDIRVAERFDRTIYMEMYSGDEFVFGAYLISYDSDAIWDSDIANGEYAYRQIVSIALNKENADTTSVADVMRFFLDVARKDNLEMLVKSSVHDDICYIKDGNIAWNEAFYSHYKSMISYN